MLRTSIELPPAPILVGTFSGLVRSILTLSLCPLVAPLPSQFFSMPNGMTELTSEWSLTEKVSELAMLLLLLLPAINIALPLPPASGFSPGLLSDNRSSFICSEISAPLPLALPLARPAAPGTWLSDILLLVVGDGVMVDVVKRVSRLSARIENEKHCKHCYPKPEVS